MSTRFANLSGLLLSDVSNVVTLRRRFIRRELTLLRAINFALKHLINCFSLSIYIERAGIFRGDQYFLISRQKHRLCVLIRTVLVLMSMFKPCLEQKKENMKITLVNCGLLL